MEWQNTWEESSTDQLNATPVVGQLTDDNEDGLINADDVPGIWRVLEPPPLVSGLRPCACRREMERPRTGAAQWWTRCACGPSGAAPALGDTDADGVPEITSGPSPDDDGINYNATGAGVRTATWHGCSPPASSTR